MIAEPEPLWTVEVYLADATTSADFFTVAAVRKLVEDMKGQPGIDRIVIRYDSELLTVWP